MTYFHRAICLSYHTFTYTKLFDFLWYPKHKKKAYSNNTVPVEGTGISTTLNIWWLRGCSNTIIYLGGEGSHLTPWTNCHMNVKNFWKKIVKFLTIFWDSNGNFPKGQVLMEMLSNTFSSLSWKNGTLKEKMCFFNYYLYYGIILWLKI